LTFFERLEAAAARNRSRLCVGLDPDPERIPGGDVASFLREVVAATSDLVCCYKPNLAFFEAMGDAGNAALRAALATIPDRVPVLADAKRGDIGSTAEAYARALFDVWGFDAATVNPYGGGDTVAPFLAYADRGVFVWCRSSNPGAGDFQNLPVSDGTEPSRPLYEVVAQRARTWNAASAQTYRFLCRASAPRGRRSRTRFKPPHLPTAADSSSTSRAACSMHPLGRTSRGPRGRRRWSCATPSTMHRPRGRVCEAAMSDPVEFRMADIVRLRKPHPCGSFEWQVVRVGADIRLECLTCRRRVLLPRRELEKRLKSFLSRGPVLPDLPITTLPG